jgi:flagellar biosynthesis protein FliR
VAKTSLMPTLPLELLTLHPGELAAAGLAAIRVGAAVSVLPVLETVPLRARIAIILVLGVALGGAHTDSVATWSLASAVSEIATGVTLGIGLRVTLSALQIAGTWIDEQTSTGLTAEPVLPNTDDNTSGSAQVLIWIGAWLILTTPPWGGDLAVMQRAIDSLTIIPLGTIVSPSGIPEWTIGLLRGWSELAIGVALPVCLVAGLIQAGLAMLGRGLGVGIGQAMSPIRAALTGVLLMVALPWQAEKVGSRESGACLWPSSILHPPSTLPRSLIDE